MKDTGVAAETTYIRKSKIEELTKKLTEVKEEDDGNPFDNLSDEDDDEIKNNETVIDESHSDENSSANELFNSEEPSDTEA